MYLWHTSELAAQLKHGGVSQHDRFRYLLVFIVIIALGIELASYLERASSVLDISESVLTVMVIVFGSVWCYQVNKKGDDQNFVERYICLNVPIFFRLIVLFIVLYSAYLLCGALTFGEHFRGHLERTTLVDVAFGVLYEVLFYWRLSVNIRWISGGAGGKLGVHGGE